VPVSERLGSFHCPLLVLLWQELPHRPTTRACEKTQFPPSCGPAGDVNYVIQIAPHEVGQAASQPFLFYHRRPASQFNSPKTKAYPSETCCDALSPEESMQAVGAAVA
jgi:hypothetical protein